MTEPWPDLNDTLTGLEDELRAIYAEDPAHARPRMEALLATRLAHLAPGERLGALETLEGRFRSWGKGQAGLGVLSRSEIIGALLGKDLDVDSIEPGELVARLSDALGSVFKALNEIVGAIHGELGAAPGGNETIRGIVGAAVQGLEGAPTVEEYIGAIKKAFLAAAGASREAAKALAGFIMAELDPAAMDAAKGGLAIGPLKKAQAFEAYEDAYARVRRWFESDRFMLDFQRQFEKNCLRFLEHHGG